MLPYRKIDSAITSVNDGVPQNVSLTEDIKSSVSELESVITKTIENTENIEDIPSLIIEYNSSKEEGEPTLLTSTTATTTTTTQLPTTINLTTKLPTTILIATTPISSSQPPSSPTTITTAKTSSTIAQTDDNNVYENSSTRDEIEDTLTTVDFVEKVIEPELMTTHKVCILNEPTRTVC